MAVSAENLVAIQKIMGVKIKFLGSLLWYTITDCRVTREQLEEAFNEAGIDVAYLPKPKCARDAFRRASRAGEIKNYMLEQGKYLNILVRDVRQDKEKLVRQMVREVVDSHNVRLVYIPVASLVLAEGSLKTHVLRSLHNIEKLALQKIQDEYKTEKVNYNGRTIRDIVTAVLRTCSPVAVRQSGGVYFVPERYTETVKALQRLVNKLSDYSITGNKNSLWSIPVIDAAEQRQMLGESLEIQIKEESQALIEEMTKALQGGRKITSRLAQQYAQRAKGLKKLVEEYEEMLEMQATTARASLELAISEAIKLMEKVEEEQDG